MKFQSTRRKSPRVGFMEAVFQAMPPDNGLYMPDYIPRLPDHLIEGFSDHSLRDIALEVLYPYLADEMDRGQLRDLVEEVFSFPVPLVPAGDNRFILELFHGPTFAFKDMGARFLARCLSASGSQQRSKLTVLTATSGDTGSAVAHGFYGVANVDVVILYPSGQISEFQERQMTTLGGNITTLEVQGTFDDCQSMVKKAFLDPELRSVRSLTSANSINIARLLPQSVYYFHAFARLASGAPQPVTFSVPSGNYGNLTAGVMAQRMGLPVKCFLACSNINDTVPRYLATGDYVPKASTPTISNAMDVGAPSNFERLLDLFNHRHQNMADFIKGYSFTDEEIRRAIGSAYRKTGYIPDPHTAVGYLGMQEYAAEHPEPVITLGTAHPLKFRSIVEDAINKPLDFPDACRDSGAPRNNIVIGNDYPQLKKYLLNSQI